MVHIVRSVRPPPGGHRKAKMRMQIAGAAAALATLSMGAAMVPAAGASTDTRPCVTRGEYVEARTYMSIERVQDKFDQRGVELYRAGGWMEKEYFTCTGGSVNITYKHNRTRGTWVLRYKYADWY